jgi:hypothetical protein
LLPRTEAPPPSIKLTVGELFGHKIPWDDLHPGLAYYMSTSRLCDLATESIRFEVEDYRHLIAELTGGAEASCGAESFGRHLGGGWVDDSDNSDEDDDPREWRRKVERSGDGRQWRSNSFDEHSSEIAADSSGDSDTDTDDPHKRRGKKRKLLKANRKRKRKGVSYGSATQFDKYSIEDVVEFPEYTDIDALASHLKTLWDDIGANKKRSKVAESQLPEGGKKKVKDKCKKFRVWK